MDREQRALQLECDPAGLVVRKGDVSRALPADWLIADWEGLLAEAKKSLESEKPFGFDLTTDLPFGVESEMNFDDEDEWFAGGRCLLGVCCCAEESDWPEEFQAKVVDLVRQSESLAKELQAKGEAYDIQLEQELEEEQELV